MKIVLTIDEKKGIEIENAAKKEGMTIEEWLSTKISEYISGKDRDEGDSTESQALIEKRDNEISRLNEEIKLQIELKEAYGKLVEEKNCRIDDLKEEITRIEVMSVTTADQITQDKDDRIKDLTKMIEHLQGQAAAHSLALQSAIRSREKDDMEPETENTEKSINRELIEKPRWMFWK